MSVRDKLSEKSMKEESGCIVFTGARCRGGYGNIWNNGKYRNTHVVSYEQYVGEIPKGKIVMHTCDNPPCINPDHLRIGTKRENEDDKLAKQRQARGSKHGRHVLSEDQVREIRSHLNDGKLLQREIGALYGVAADAIGAIKRGQNWSWLT